MMYRSERHTIALAIAALGPFALAAGAGIGYLSNLPAPAPVVAASVLPVQLAPSTPAPSRALPKPRRVAAPALHALPQPPLESPMTAPRHAAPESDAAPPTSVPTDAPPTTEAPVTGTPAHAAPSHSSAPATTGLPAPATTAAPVTSTVPPSGSPIYDTLRAEHIANLMHAPAP